MTTYCLVEQRLHQLLAGEVVERRVQSVKEFIGELLGCPVL